MRGPLERVEKRVVTILLELETLQRNIDNAVITDKQLNNIKKTIGCSVDTLHNKNEEFKLE